MRARDLKRNTILHYNNRLDADPNIYFIVVEEYPRFKAFLKFNTVFYFDSYENLDSEDEFVTDIFT